MRASLMFQIVCGEGRIHQPRKRLLSNCENKTPSTNGRPTRLDASLCLACFILVLCKSSFHPNLGTSDPGPLFTQDLVHELETHS